MQKNGHQIDSHPKCEKMAAKLSKNKMFIFGLCSTSDDRLRDLSDDSHPKCKNEKECQHCTSTKWAEMGHVQNVHNVPNDTAFSKIRLPGWMLCHLEHFFLLLVKFDEYALSYGMDLNAFDLKDNLNIYCK